MAAVAILPMTSCVDDNDWKTDASHNRLFGVNSSKLSVETEDNAPTKATVTFTPYDKRADYYIIEVSRDSLYDDVPMGGENSVVYGTDGSITASPVELQNLLEYTKYYLRVKAVSASIPESKWVYYKDGDSFRTPGVLHDILDADRLDTSVRLSWIAGTKATKIVYTFTQDDEPVSVEVPLTDEILAAAEYTVTGLKPNKTYMFEIYNGDVLLGAKTCKTAKGMPSANLQYYMADDETEITNDLLSRLSDEAFAASGEATATLAIGIPAGKTLTLGTETAGLTIPDGLSVTFFGRAGEKATLNAYKSMKFENNAGFISFEHVNINGQYDADNNKEGCAYLVNQSGACTVDSIGFTECNISNLKSSLVRMQGGQTVNKLSIDNCIVDNHSGAYAFLCFDKANTVLNKVSIKNSTFSNLCMGKKAFLDITNVANKLTVDIESCTFYNILGDGAYLISCKSGGMYVDENKKEPKVPNVTANISKVVIAKSFTVNARGYQNKESVTLNVSSSYLTKDFVMAAGTFADKFSSIDETASGVFKSPATGDFTVKSTVLEVNQVGDPRWLK